MRRSSILRTAGIILLSFGVASAAGVLVVRDQFARHQRNLFSPHVLRRFAALGYLSGAIASVELVRLLRDFARWEPSPILRKRAAQITARMERDLQTQPPRHPHDVPAGIAG
ncbi:MAG TPA: hypothetical protein VK936_05425 [Longimicrobiales bacterium]|nr:hypothetical protein [Longimicrobiales bacterium]